ncbi:membrane or secreted protein [Nonlabens arenilitoris]|uniref:Membrane or secreted protein n=1 Tax=Nonlabens arenilitoris TaxID=1217969 RepID=A0A2S7UA74_9FLAO|nr:membrane or secreted protein [Nonlabens arenilitoris]PQJ31304.1 membrane or secreted protein [Nonlabens arenilitoris]
MSDFPKAEGIKQTSEFSKKFVIVVLFALPLVAYLFFLNGEHHFETLPVVTENVQEIDQFNIIQGTATQLKDSVTIVTFLGNNPYGRLGYVSNLNEKIYKKFHGFNTFQMISIIPESGVDDIQQIVEQMGENTDLQDWHFLSGDNDQVQGLYDSFKTDDRLNNDLSSDYAFVIDVDRNLRGRDDDEIETDGVVYGYNTRTAAQLNKRMIDDMRVLLAEYRFAFKKNRDQKIQEDE